jgi:hypothetical protein
MPEIEAAVIDAKQCRDFSAECMTLGLDASISIQRASVLLAMSRCWATLGNQMEMYETIVEEESRFT